LRDETSGRLHGPTVTARVPGLRYGGDYNPEPGRYTFDWLDELLGISVDEIVPMADGERQAVAWDGHAYPCRDLCDVLTVGDATALATFTDDFYAGQAAVTRRVAGAGSAWYVAARPGPELAAALVAALCRDAGVQPGPAAADGVEAVRREHADRRFLFLLNHGAEAAEVTLAPGCRSLLDGGRELGAVTLEPGGVAVLEGPARPARAREPGPVTDRETEPRAARPPGQARSRETGS
jgi:beta-galactosidase